MALQPIRQWTTATHDAIRRITVEVSGPSSVERFCHERRVIFRSGDLLRHGKRLTAASSDFAVDATVDHIDPDSRIMAAEQPSFVHKGKGRR